jgi:hypothetical protein
MKTVILLVLVVGGISACAQQPPVAGEKYESAEIYAPGKIRIRTVDGRNIIPPKDVDRVEVSSLLLSPDETAVGWLALYPNPATSYPIPLNLILYSNGIVTKLEGNGLPVWQWCFLSGGKQVGFEQETVHGGLGVHYELRDVGTGKLVAKYDPHTDADGHVDDKPAERPGWVKAVDAAK